MKNYFCFIFTLLFFPLSAGSLRDAAESERLGYTVQVKSAFQSVGETLEDADLFGKTFAEFEEGHLDDDHPIFGTGRALVDQAHKSRTHKISRDKNGGNNGITVFIDPHNRRFAVQKNMTEEAFLYALSRYAGLSCVVPNFVLNKSMGTTAEQFVALTRPGAPLPEELQDLQKYTLFGGSLILNILAQGLMQAKGDSAGRADFHSFLTQHVEKQSFEEMSLFHLLTAVTDLKERNIGLHHCPDGKLRPYTFDTGFAMRSIRMENITLEMVLTRSLSEISRSIVLSWKKLIGDTSLQERIDSIYKNNTYSAFFRFRVSAIVDFVSRFPTCTFYDLYCYSFLGTCDHQGNPKQTLEYAMDVLGSLGNTLDRALMNDQESKLKLKFEREQLLWALDHLYWGTEELPSAGSLVPAIRAQLKKNAKVETHEAHKAAISTVLAKLDSFYPEAHP